METSAPTVIFSLDSELAKRWPAKITVSEVEALLVQAIFEGKVAVCARELLELPDEYLEAESLALAQTAQNTCGVIDAETVAEQGRVLRLLNAAGIDARSSRQKSSGNQYHSFELRVATQDLEAALDVADSAGFRRWAPTRGGGWESYRRTHTAVTLIRTDDVTMRWVLRWSDTQRPGRLHSLLQPSLVDYRLVDLPTLLWPLYHLLRPVRLVFDRLVRFRRQAAWVFLGTPTSLVPSLLEFGEVTGADRIVDLGCGDGRILVHAAQRLGCKAYGIEQDPDLARLARERAEAASVSDRVTIETGDAATADLETASVVFLFLPQDAIRRLVPQLLQRLPSGARILAHEQVPLHGSPTPDATMPIFAGNSLTVAHRWIVTNCRTSKK
jgi:hypothetical protein